MHVRRGAEDNYETQLTQNCVLFKRQLYNMAQVIDINYMQSNDANELEVRQNIRAALASVRQHKGPMLASSVAAHR